MNKNHLSNPYLLVEDGFSDRVFNVIKSRLALFLATCVLLLAQIFHSSFVFSHESKVLTNFDAQTRNTLFFMFATGLDLLVLMFAVHGWKWVSAFFAFTAILVDLKAFGQDYHNLHFDYSLIISVSMGIAQGCTAHLFAQLQDAYEANKEKNNTLVFGFEDMQARLKEANNTISQLQLVSSSDSVIKETYSVEIQDLKQQLINQKQDFITELQKLNDIYSNTFSQLSEQSETQKENCLEVLTELEQVKEDKAKLAEQMKSLTLDYELLEKRAGKHECPFCKSRFFSQQALAPHISKCTLNPESPKYTGEESEVEGV